MGMGWWVNMCVDRYNNPACLEVLSGRSVTTDFISHTLLSLSPFLSFILVPRLFFFVKYWFALE